MKFVSWRHLLLSLWHSIKPRSKRRRFASIAQYELLEDRTLLATAVWDGGGTDNNFSTAANWANDVAPVSGDDLVFPAAASRFVPNNNLSSFSFSSITFYAGGYNVGGNAFTLNGPISAFNSAGQNRIGTSTITLGANVTITNTFLGTNLAIDAAIALNSKTLTFDAEGAITQSTGVISGSGTINKDGGNTVTFSGANTYTGVTNINSGILVIGNGAGLGSSVAGSNTVVAKGAQVQMGNLTTSEMFTISGHGIFDGHETTTTTAALAGRASGALLGTTGTATFNGAITLAADATIANTGGAATYAGAIALAGNTLTINAGNAQTITLNSVISGAGNVRFGDQYAAGTVNVQALNTYTGTTVITSGTVALTGANGALQGSGNVLGTITVRPGAILNLTNTSNNNSDRIQDTADINLGGGTLSFLGNTGGTSTETVDVITLERGHSTINSSPGSASRSNVLTASSLVRNATATANFTSSNVTLGTAGAIENRIIFATPPTEIGSGKSSYSGEGILPYALVNNADFANYDTSLNTLIAFPSNAYYVDDFSPPGVSADAIIKVTATSPSLSATKSYAALLFAPTANQTLNLVSNTLGVGVIAKTSAGFTTQITGGTIDFIGTGVSSGEGLSIIGGNTMTYTSPFATGNRLILSGAGTQSINGAKTYTGGTTINSGTVSLATNSSTLGASGTVTWVAGTLTASASTTFTRNLSLTDANVTIGSTNVIVGTAGGSETLTVTGRNLINLTAATTINSQITGPGAFIKTSAQTLTIRDTNNNPGGFVFDNAVTISPTPSGGLPLGSGSTQLTLTGAPNITVTNTGGLTFSNPVDIRCSGTTWTISGTQPMTLSGAVSVEGMANINAARQSNTTNLLTFSGTLSGTGGFDLTGTGDVVFNPSSSTNSGAIRASVGSLIVNGQMDSAPVSVANDATGSPSGGSGMTRLSGTGTVGSVAASNDGTIAPGSTSAIGKLTVNGQFNISEGGLLLTRATGYTTAGTDYSQLAVTGASVAALGGQSSVIVETSGLTVSGTLENLISVTTVQRETTSLPIGVIGTTNNVAVNTEVTGVGIDVNLALMDTVRTTPSLTATKIWDGGGSDNNFSTATNWVGDVAPVANDNLVFPNGAIRQSPNNDFPANTVFSSIIFYGDTYNISGNTMNLASNGSIASYNHDGTNTLSLPIVLAGNATFASTFIGTTLSFASTATITFGANSTLTVDGSSTTTFAGVVADSSFTGAITKDGSGTLNLNAANTYKGVTRVNAGILVAGNTTALGTTAGNTVVAVGAQLQVGGISVAEPLNLSGHGIFDGRETTTTTAALALRSSGALLFTGGGTLTGAVTLAANATIAASSGTTTVSSTIATAGFTITANANNQTFNLTGIISGTGSLRVNDNFNSGTVVLQAANTYTGTTTVRAGAMQLTAANGALLGAGTGIGTITIEPGASLSLVNTTNNNTNRIVDSADIILNGGTLSFLGLNAGASTETVDQITLGKGHSTISSTVGTGTASNVLTASTLTRNATATVNFTGATLGTTAVGTENRIVFTAAPGEVGEGATTNTEGILPYALVNSADFANYDGIGNTIRAFPAAEYYTAFTALPATPTGQEILKLSNASESVDAPASVVGIMLNPAATQTFTLNSSLTAGVIAKSSTGFSTNISGAATLDMTGTSITSDEGICLIGASGNTLTFTSNFTSATQLVLGGGGTFTVSGNKAHTGGTVINSGAVSITAAGSLGTGSVTWVSGALSATSGVTLTNNFALNDSNVVVGGNLTIGNSVSTFNVTGRNRMDQSGATTIAAQITGPGVYIKTGGQNITFTNTSNDPGGFVLENNTINVNTSPSTGSSLGTSATQLTLLGNITFATNVAAGMVFPNPIDIRGNGQTMTFSGSNSYTFSGAGTFRGNTTFSVTTSAAVGLVFSGDISGTGGIDKTSGGRLAFTNTPKTFSGAIRVQSGSIFVDAATSADVSLTSAASSTSIYPTYLGSSGTTAAVRSLTTSNNTFIAVGDNYNPGAASLVQTEGFGILTAARVNLTEGGRVNLNANGFTTAGTNYDRLNVTGDLVIGGIGSVSVETNGITAPGTFDDMIVANRTLGDPNALPLDVFDVANSTDFLVQMTYSTVDVTIIPVSNSGVAIWEGGTNANWATATNWSGGDLPANGQSLVFPENAGFLTNSNNYSSLTNIGGIAFLKDGYTLNNSGGSTLSISGGISDASSTATANNVNVSLNLTASQGFRTIRTAGDNLNVGGNLSGSAGTLTIDAPSGTVKYTGTSTYSGAVSVTNGNFRVDGTTAAGSSTTVNNGGTLSGGGALNGPVSVASGGKVAPGTSPGVLDTGNLTLASGSTYEVEVNGATAGTLYDQLDVVGTVTLSNATLTTTFGYSPASGTAYTIINNDGSDSVVGTFNGIAHASAVVLSGMRFYAVYNGGDGNDVVFTFDNIAPSTTSFARQTPSSTPTNADTLVYRATFSEGVTNVSASDFSVTGTTATVTAVTAVSSSVYDLTVSGGDLAALNGTVGLDFAVSQDITDLAGNLLPTTEPTVDETYLFDNLAPSTTSFVRLTPASTPTNADSLVFRTTFSETVVNVSSADFDVVSTSTASVTGVSPVSGTVYDITISGGNLAGFDGTVGIDLANTGNITDSAGNALPITEPSTDQTYTVDNINPTVLSIVRSNPTVTTTNSNTLVFRVTFSETVSNVTASDFALDGTSTGSVTTVSAISSTAYDVTVSGGDISSFNGVVGLNFDSAGDIADSAGNSLIISEPSTDESYTLDNIVPEALSFTRLNPLTSPTTETVLTFQITFSETVYNVDKTDFVASNSGGATITTFTAVSDTVYEAIVSGGTLSNYTGSVSLNINSASNITDLAGNQLSRTEPSVDQTFVVDTATPVIDINILASRLTNVTLSSTVLFTFSEAVFGFTESDLTVTNGTISDFTGSGTSYSATFTAIDGARTTGTVSVAAGIATDNVGLPTNADADSVLIDTTSSAGVFLDGTLTLRGIANETEDLLIAVGPQWTDVSVVGKWAARIASATTSTLLAINFATTDSLDRLTISGTTAPVTVDLNSAQYFAAKNTGNVTVNADDRLELGASVTTGSLTITTGGDVADSGKLMIGGDLTVVAAGHLIALDTTGNSYGAVSLSGVNAVIVEGADTVLGAIDLSGTFKLTTSGNVSQSSAVTVDGVATINAVGKSISLTNNSNAFGSLEINAKDAAVSEGDAIEVATVNATGNLTLVSKAEIADTGKLNVVGKASFSGTSVTLASTSSNFGSLSFTTTGNVSVIEASGTDLSVSSIAGNFELLTRGAVTDSGKVEITGETQITTSAQTITLDDKTSLYTGPVSLNGTKVLLTNNRATDLGSIVASEFTLASTGKVTDSSSLTVTGATRITAEGQIVELDEPNNNFGSLAITAGDTTIVEASGTDFGVSTISGTLTVSSEGNITDSGKLVTTGATRLTAMSGGSDIILDNSGCSLGTLILESQKAVIVETGNASIGASLIYGDLTLKTTGGNITQSGSVYVVGTATFGASGSITLEDSGNYVGKVSLSGTTVKFAEGDDTDIGATKTTSLKIASAGEITDSGVILTTGETRFEAGNGGSNVTLDLPGHSLGTISLLADSAYVRESSALDFGSVSIANNLTTVSVGAVTDSGTIQVGGMLSVNASGYAITLNDTASKFGNVALSGAAMILYEADDTDLGGVSGVSLTVTSAGAITDSAPINLLQKLTAYAPGQDIVLDESNSFGSIAATGDLIEIAEGNATDLAGISATTFKISSKGVVTDSGAVTATTSQIHSTDAVTLDFATSNYGSLSLAGTKVSVVNTGASGIELGVVEVTDLAVSAKSITQNDLVIVSGLVTLNSGGGNITLDLANSIGSIGVTGNAVVLNVTGPLNFATSKVAGKLEISTIGAVTQTGPLAVAGAVLIDSSNSAISLTNNANAILGAISLQGSEIAITNGKTTKIAASTASASLAVTSTGAITDEGIISVGTTASFVALNSDIALDQTNEFPGLLSLSGKAIAVSGVSSLALGTLNANGAVTLSTSGGISLGASKVSGPLSLTAGGDIIESGVLNVTGTVTLNAAGQDVNLATTPGHSFGTVVVTNAANVSIRETGATDLGNINVAGVFSLITTGNVTDSGNVMVGGSTSINADKSQIVLDKASQYGSSLSITGNNVTITDNIPLVFGETTVYGTLTVITNGDVSFMDGLSVSSVTSITAGSANNVMIDSANLTTLKIGRANHVTVVEVGDLDLGDSQIAGNLTVAVEGPLTDSGKLVVDGTTLITANGLDVTLDSVQSKFMNAVNVVGNNVAISNSIPTNLGAIDASGNLTVLSASDIFDTDDLLVDGTTFLRANAADINIDGANSEFVGAVSLSGKNVVFENHAETVIDKAMATGFLTVRSHGYSLSSSANTFSAQGAATFDAGMADVSLNVPAAKLLGTVSLAGGNVTLVAAGALKFGPTSVVGNLSVVGGGNMDDFGTITVGGTASFDAGVNAAIVFDAANEFGGAISVSSKVATVTNSIDTVLGTIATVGALTINSKMGSVMSTGVIKTGALTTINAPGHDITLNATGNQFGALSIYGKNVEIRENAAVDFGVSVISGDLTLAANGHVTDSGKLTVLGAMTIVTSSFGSVTFDVAGSTFVGIVSIDASNISLVNAASLIFGTTHAGGNMTIKVTGNNNVTDVGVVTVLGDVSVNAGLGSIDFDSPVFRGAVQLLAASVNYV